MSEEDDALLELDLTAFDPKATQKILAAIDKSVDPHISIDITRRAIFKLAVRIQQMGRLIRSLENDVRDLKGKKPLTDTGVWRVVQAKLNEQEVSWVRRILWAAACGLGTALLGALGWVLTLAWKGYHAT